MYISNMGYPEADLERQAAFLRPEYFQSSNLEGNGTFLLVSLGSWSVDFTGSIHHPRLSLSLFLPHSLSPPSPKSPSPFLLAPLPLQHKVQLALYGAGQWRGHGWRVSGSGRLYLTVSIAYEWSADRPFFNCLPT
jgi:hypothetical protein